MRLSIVKLLIVPMLAIGLAGCGEKVQQSQAIDHYVTGQILAEQGETDAALEELARALKYNPDLDVAYSAIGDIHRHQGNYDAARESYERACEVNPYSFRPHYNLGVTYQILAAATRTIQRMDEYLFKAVAVYLRAVTLEPTDFEANLNISACYFQLGKFDLAEQYCRAAIKISPNSPQAYSNLGIIYDGLNRPNDAIAAFRNSLDLDTRQPKLLLNMGSTYMRQGIHKQAMHCYDLALRQDATLAAAYELKGMCSHQMKDYQQSLECYQRALLLDPKSAIAHRGVGIAYMSQYVLDNSLEDYRENAISSWRKSLDIEPDQDDLLRLIERYDPIAPGRL